jgi:hypothetical protein
VKGFQSRPPKKAGAWGTAILPGSLDGGNPGDFFALVYVPPTPEAFEFFLATRQELEGIKNRNGPAAAKFTSDWLYYPDLIQFRDA